MLSELFVIVMYSTNCDVKPGSKTKSGVTPVVGWTVAADPTVLPIGSIIEIDGFGERMVQDIGGGVKGEMVDIFVSTCKEAKEWGRRKRRVTVKHLPRENSRTARKSMGGRRIK